MLTAWTIPTYGDGGGDDIEPSRSGPPAKMLPTSSSAILGRRHVEHQCEQSGVFDELLHRASTRPGRMEDERLEAFGERVAQRCDQLVS